MKKLLTLVVAGVALNYFLKTEQGKQLKDKIMGWIDDLESSLDDKIPAVREKIEQTARSTDQYLPKMDSN